MRRYDLTEFEWRVIEPLLPNKPRGVPRVDDRRVLNGIFWVLAQARPGATCRSVMAPTPLATTAFGAGQSRGGLTPKIHALTDADGLPVKLVITPGQTHDIQAAAELLGDLRKGQMVLADKAYDADWLRAMVGEQGAWANIPPKSNRKSPICFSPALYKQRNLIERLLTLRVAFGSTNSNTTDG